jgi:hypothetical protein
LPIFITEFSFFTPFWIDDMGHRFRWPIVFNFPRAVVRTTPDHYRGLKIHPSADTIRDMTTIPSKIALAVKICNKINLEMAQTLKEMENNNYQITI